MISTVDIILKKLAKNRQKPKSKHGLEVSSDSEPEHDNKLQISDDDKRTDAIPKPTIRTSKRQPVPKESGSDDSGTLRKAHRTGQKEQKPRRPSIDSLQSQDWQETRRDVKNRSTKSNVETKRKKKPKNVRASTRSKTKTTSSKNKGSKYVEDVQSDDEERLHEPINTLSKRFKSVDMLNSGKDFDTESKSESELSLKIQKDERKSKESQLSKKDSDSDSSLRRREEIRKRKHKELYLELKRRQEQERKEQLLEQKRAEYQRQRVKSEGRLSPNSETIVQRLQLGDTSVQKYSSTNPHSDGEHYNADRRGPQTPSPKPWAETSVDDRQVSAGSVKHMVLESNPTGARSKHHVTTQAVIEHSIRQSERRHAAPVVPSKPNKKKDIQPETHTFTALPPSSSGNFQRGYHTGSLNPGGSLPSQVRGSYRPQQEQHVTDDYRPATLSHSRRHDYNQPPRSSPYEMNQQWHQDEFDSRGYEQSRPYGNQKLNQEIYPQEHPYHPHEYEKYAPSYNEDSLPRDTHYRNQNRLVPDEVPFDPRYQNADLV